ncbi:MAG: hypothetical protein U0587_16265 [Candidatus Binatia bacterium]
MKSPGQFAGVFIRRARRGADRSNEPSESPVVLRFDPRHPDAVQWAATSSMAHVPGIDDRTRTALREILARGFRERLRPTAIAKEIAALLGLIPEDASALGGDRHTPVEELSATVMRRTVAKLDMLVEMRVRRYRYRQLFDRAFALVRCETIRASSVRQTAHWKRAQELGYLGDDARMVWLTAADAYTCPVCRAIPRMNPDGAPIAGAFQTPVGPLASPPACPTCRCATVLNPGHGGVLRLEDTVRRCMHCGAQVISFAVVCPRCDTPPVRRIIPGIND